MANRAGAGWRFLNRDKNVNADGLNRFVIVTDLFVDLILLWKYESFRKDRLYIFMAWSVLFKGLG